MRRLLTIATSWDGASVAEPARAHVAVSWDDGLTITVDAPFAGDAAPAASSSGSIGGRTDRLWEHEVVEVFVAEHAGRDARYLEVELGPRGHWLALGFAGYRARVVEDVTVAFTARIDRAGDRWQGEARVAAAEIARVVRHVGAINAYAIRGVGPARRFYAAAPVLAGLYAGPDFHRLEHFAPV